jgi:hypothetical protein
MKASRGSCCAVLIPAKLGSETAVTRRHVIYRPRQEAGPAGTWLLGVIPGGQGWLLADQVLGKHAAARMCLPRFAWATSW